MILWSFLLVYSRIIRERRGERSSRPSKLGVEETILDLSDRIEEVLIETGTKSLCG